MTRDDDMDMASTRCQQQARTREEIHRHEYDLSSILCLSVDGVGCASDISFEAEQLWLGCKAKLCEERRGIGLGESSTATHRSFALPAKLHL